MIESRLARRLKSRRRVGRPRPPNTAERLYVGAMRRYADDFATIVREQIEKDEILSAVVRADAEGFFSRVRQVLDVSFVWMARKLRELPIDRVGTATENHVKKEVERLIRIPSETVATRLTVDDWRRTNVDLVTRMTREQLDKIARVLDEYNGQNPFEIAKQLQKELDFTKSRAELVARDQVLKLNADLTEAAHKQAGITRYRWSSSQDSSVRPFHKALEGRVFSYDDPPVVNIRGDRQNPGHDYECRCVAIPILEELEGAAPKQEESKREIPQEIPREVPRVWEATRETPVVIPRVPVEIPREIPVAVAVPEKIPVVVPQEPQRVIQKEIPVAAPKAISQEVKKAIPEEPKTKAAAPSKVFKDFAAARPNEQRELLKNIPETLSEKDARALLKVLPRANVPVEMAMRFPRTVAALGTVEISGWENAKVVRVAEQLARVKPEILHSVVNSRIGGEYRGVFAAPHRLTDFKHLEYLRGVQARGWGGHTWEVVGGAGDARHATVAVGYGAEVSSSTALHEFGHSLGSRIMRDSYTLDEHPDLIKHHRRLHPKLDDYLQQEGPGGAAGRSEMLAESFGDFHMFTKAEFVRVYDEEYYEWIKAIATAERL